MRGLPWFEVILSEPLAPDQQEFLQQKTGFAVCLKNVRVSQAALTLNVYDFSSLTIPDARLENRTEWLPALDAFRNFCFSPQASLGLTLSDIDAFLVA